MSSSEGRGLGVSSTSTLIVTECRTHNFRYISSVYIYAPDDGYDNNLPKTTQLPPDDASLEPDGSPTTVLSMPGAPDTGEGTNFFNAHHIASTNGTNQCIGLKSEQWRPTICHVASAWSVSISHNGRCGQACALQRGASSISVRREGADRRQMSLCEGGSVRLHPGSPQPSLLCFSKKAYVS